MSVPTDSAINILLKQYDQKTISEFNGITPSYVDTYWGQFYDSTDENKNPLAFFSHMNGGQ